MKRIRWVVALLSMLAVSAALLSACGGDDDENGSTPATATTGGNGAAVNEIDQDNLSFKPDKLTVKAGEEVLFKNSETAVHTVNINGKNESGTMKKDDEFRWTFTNAGEYKITCDFHPQMRATITVTG
ncbi:MAG TPA: cupredoxin domain-containing protein [Tepidiformaceae bacterium]|nr:cupredoxin domain-containing protein [Tepidiformaceae bacterium]